MNEREQLIRRILVALDASAPSLVALEMAVQLAANLEAEIIGLFVEDINLLRLAGLPFAREVRRMSAATQQLSSRQVETELRAQATLARRALLAAAEQAHVNATFRVTRGRVDLELLAAALEADLLTLGRVSRPITRRVRLGSTARTVAIEASRPVLLVHARSGPRMPAMVAVDGSPLSWQALSTALRLTQPESKLTVLLVADDLAAYQALRAEVEAWLVARDASADYHWLSRFDEATLSQAVQMLGCGLLVVGGEHLHLDGEQMQRLLNAIDCSLLIVR